VRIANHDGRLALCTGDDTVDVERASDGRFSSDPQLVYDVWDEFRDWAGTGPDPTGSRGENSLSAPVPSPRQVFAVGLNYREHSEEAGFQTPAAPMIFTKFPSSITGPSGDIALPPGSVDWEIELVAVIGRRAYQVSEDRALDHVAGLTIGQDLSERESQLSGAPPQFSLAKSFPGFAPLGPLVVTMDELEQELQLTTVLNGEVVQDGSTRDLVFALPELVSRISMVCPLLPGDLIFTGTPPGVGMGRTPPRYLSPGDELVSRITGLGEMRHRFVTMADNGLAER
jgi:2,4-didehydro-3-deoxy-L-rhamnonate hydrolase